MPERRMSYAVDVAEIKLRKITVQMLLATVLIARSPKAERKAAYPLWRIQMRPAVLHPIATGCALAERTTAFGIVGGKVGRPILGRVAVRRLATLLLHCKRSRVD